MKRVVVLPLSEGTRFPDLEVIARDRNLAAFIGSTAPGRTREAYDSDESFLEAVAQGFADRYTFNTLDEAATFAKQRLDDLARAAQKNPRCSGNQGNAKTSAEEGQRQSITNDSTEEKGLV